MAFTAESCNTIYYMNSHPKIRLIGAPTDIGAGTRGASMGPEALRVAGLAEALTARGLHVVDDGNLAGPPNPWLPPSAGSFIS